MKTKILIAIVMLFSNSAFLSSAQKIDVTIKNIHNSSSGKLIVGFFTSQQEFDKQQPNFSMAFCKKDVKNGELKITIPLEVGTFGLSVLDDEDGDALMDYNFLGIPKEGFGFSNFDLKRFKKPKFSDFLFTLKDKESKSIIVNMKYML